MSNVLPLRKQREDETARLVAEFLDNGGEISRTGGGRVCVKCNVCSLASMVAVQRAARYKLSCYRCHSENVSVTW
jgi:hypothetical protein